MLWLALRLTQLPVEVFTRAGGPRAAHPFAVSDAARDRLIACNETARKRGVIPGMPLAAATALASDLRIVTRDSSAEEAALARIAAWAIQFTPAVSIAPPDEILLEVEGSLTLFGGLKSLWASLSEDLRTLGFTVSIACAPTPLAAQWFARAGLTVRLQHKDALRESLGRLPSEAMRAPPAAFALLQNLGATSVADCLALPREGLARRLGQDFIDAIDRALGLVPDPRLFFTPPTVFRSVQPLPAPAQEAEMLLFAARRLLFELCGFLAATANGVQRLTFTFSHDVLEPTKLTLSLVAATRDTDHLLSVLRERLERTALASPATALTLESELLLPLAARSLTLLPEAGREEEAAAKLIERLRARLGDEAVLGLRRCADHRPERAWRACQPGSADAPAAAYGRRPLWLLPQPRPLSEVAAAPTYDGKLTLLAGPERIESGWWDGHEVMRDYFVAANPSDALLWIYRERNQDARWFLHGFFA